MPLRLFIAVQLDPEMKKRIAGIQDGFRSRHVRGNYTPEENLHLTLAFIGEYENPKRVLDVMETVSFRPFSITMDRIGCFEELWWAGIAESPELEALVKNLRYVLADAGIPFDRKRFRGHITMLSKPVYLNGRDLLDVSVAPAGMRVSRISLMRSTRGKNGMIYTELGSVAAQ